MRFLPQLLIMLAAGLIGLTACGERQTTAEKERAAREKITEIVKDPHRQKIVLAQIDHSSALLTEKSQSEANFIARRDALNANYSATKADFQALQQQHAAEVQKLCSDFIAIRQAIIANTTEDEWKALRSARDNLRQAAATTSENGAKP